MTFLWAVNDLTWLSFLLSVTRWHCDPKSSGIWDSDPLPQRGVQTFQQCDTDTSWHMQLPQTKAVHVPGIGIERAWRSLPLDPLTTVFVVYHAVCPTLYVLLHLLALGKWTFSLPLTTMSDQCSDSYLYAHPSLPPCYLARLMAAAETASARDVVDGCARPTASRLAVVLCCCTRDCSHLKPCGLPMCYHLHPHPLFSCLTTVKAGLVIDLKGSSQVFIKSVDVHCHQDLSKFLVDLPAMSPNIRKNLAGEWVYIRQKMIAHKIFQCPAPSPKNKHWDDGCPITPRKLPRLLLANLPPNSSPISSPVPLQPLLLLESTHTPNLATGTEQAVHSDGAALVVFSSPVKSSFFPSKRGNWQLQPI